MSSGSHVEVERMQRLQHRCNELEQQLAQEKQHQQTHTNDIVTELEKRISLLEREKLTIENENRRLHDEVRMMSTELTRLRSCAASGRSEMGSSSNDEHVRLLEEQLKLFHLDFESERRDRQKAQALVDDLQQQLSVAKRELHQRDLQTMQDISQRRQAALQYYRDEYDGSHRTDSDHCGVDVVPNGVAYDEVDGARPLAEPDLTSNTNCCAASPDVTRVIPK